MSTMQQGETKSTVPFGFQWARDYISDILGRETREGDPELKGTFHCETLLVSLCGQATVDPDVGQKMLRALGPELMHALVRTAP